MDQVLSHLHTGTFRDKNVGNRLLYSKLSRRFLLDYVFMQIYLYYETTTPSGEHDLIVMYSITMSAAGVVFAVCTNLFSFDALLVPTA